MLDYRGFTVYLVSSFHRILRAFLTEEHKMVKKAFKQQQVATKTAKK
jgi:hypothetical protein